MASQTQCCLCNGRKARCVRCVCVRSNKPCSSCRPGRRGICQNTSVQTSLSLDISRPVDHTVASVDYLSRGDESSVNVVSGGDESTANVSSSNQSSFVFTGTSVTPSSFGLDVDRLLTSSEVDVLMSRAFDFTLTKDLAISGGDRISLERWQSIIQLSGKHYDLPRGPCGRRYIDLLSEEIRHLSRGNYPSDRLIVFSSVVLQRDKLVRTGTDIRRTLNRRMSMWEENKFDLLVQEAIRCDCDISLYNQRVHNNNHTMKMFTRLMLQGKLRPLCAD